MHPEKNWLDKIQNGRLSAIIHFHMADIWSTVLDGWTITINRNVRFKIRMHLEKVWLKQIQNGRLSAISHFHMAVIW